MLIIIGVAGLLALTFTSQLSERIGVASPLILLALGVVIGLFPQVSSLDIAPKILLEVILPPLLFAAAVSMPVMDFRRDLLAVAGLAVGLVVISAVVLGAVVHWLVPEIPLAWAIGLGAVISPTDAVATAMTKRQGVARRVVTVLEGEGLFNDATALVLLAAAIRTAEHVDGGTLEPGNLALQFLIALAIAVAVGLVVGELGIRVRARIRDAATDTVFSFAMPFLASVPATHLGGSGLVAAVVAGLVVSHRRVLLLPAWNRRYAQFNWRTVQLQLESFVFLTMGIQAYGIVKDVASGPAHLGIGRAITMVVVVSVLTLLVRAGFVAPFLWWMGRLHKRTSKRLERTEERLKSIEARIAGACAVDDEMFNINNVSTEEWNAAAKQWHKRLERGWKGHKRRGNDLAYFMREPLGVREGAIVVWAGMRGAVTLAAAQTLPAETPERSFLLLIALLVAAGSLAIQGLSLPWVIRVVKPMRAEDVRDDAEREKLLSLLASTLKDSALAKALEDGHSAPLAAPMEESVVLGTKLASIAANASSTDEGADSEDAETRDLMKKKAASEARVRKNVEPLTREQVRKLALEAIREQREALMDARDEGVFSAQALEDVLERLDHEEIMLTPLQ